MVALVSDLDGLYDVGIPSLAYSALIATMLLGVRTSVAMLEAVRGKIARAAGIKRKLPTYGRKGLLVTTSSVLFCTSCAYRSHFIADEGAFLCRGPPSAWNAPWAGRLVATVGELALIMQLSTYFEDTARRLDVPSILFAAKRRTLPLGVLAESLSWAGVMAGEPRFFCLEYVCWMGIGAMWAWDAAELLHRSRLWGDSAIHALLVVVSLGLVVFNALHELPHFFWHHSESHSELPSAGAVSRNDLDTLSTSTRPLAQGNAFHCVQEKDSPIWRARLPFFVTYFVCCSWLSAALSTRYYLHGGEKAGKGALRSMLTSLVC